MLETRTRYLQIAFNSDISTVLKILPAIPRSDRILIEAGTPFIKNAGMTGVRLIASMWPGKIVADLKTADGAMEEVQMAGASGATAATVLGNSATESLNIFIETCKAMRMDSMIDMIGVDEPLKKMLKLRHKPDVVILHLGRDEETTKGKMIQYKHVNKIKSKFDVLISAAGGVDLRSARSAIFNGANIVVANIVRPTDMWKGISTESDVANMAEQFLKTIE